jgi:hypothetical protein
MCALPDMFPYPQASRPTGVEVTGKIMTSLISINYVKCMLLTC